jgi:2-hydroxycyclohexanecarboxyl-CoA dehydrogenase
MTRMRVALVTGGGANVGRALAHRLMADGVADKVVVNDLDLTKAETVADEIRARGHDAIGYAADVTDWSAVQQMFAAVGGIDILINNAGLPVSWATPKRFVDTSPEDWMPWINLNLFGVMHMTRCALPNMIERGWGRVVTIVSDAGRTGEPRLGAYGAGKAGAAALMRSVAKEVGGSGVTCNNVSLGGLAHGAASLSEDQIKGMLKNYIVPRLGQSEDPAGLVSFLASDDSSWISGQTIAVNGGYTVSL